MKYKLLSLLFSIAFLFAGCTPNIGQVTAYPNPESQGTVATLGDDNTGFGEELEDSGIYDGMFEEDSADITVEWISGTENAYRLEGDTLTFTAVSEETVYAISGTFTGNIVIDIGDAYAFELELSGLSLVSPDTNPITVLSGDEVAIQAKKDTQNYIYDTRPAADDSQYAAAIHSEVDLEISGKGQLTVVSENNNGIHSKDDLQVKNLRTERAICHSCLRTL